MNKLWEVLELYKHMAKENGYGKSWDNMCKKKSYNATEKALSDIHLVYLNEDIKEYYYVTDALCEVMDVIWAFDNETNDGSIEHFSDTAIDYMIQAIKSHDSGVQ